MDPGRDPPLHLLPPSGGAKASPALLEALPHLQAVYCGLAQQPCLLLLADDRVAISFGLTSPELRLAAPRLGALCGADWSEAVRGTNALALAQIGGAPAQVKSREHYLQTLKTWSGAAVPLGGDRGLVALYAQAPELHRCALPLLEALAEFAPRAAQTEAKAATVLALDALATGDRRLAVAVDRAKRILDHDIPLLIQGETGTGKEVFARAFHLSGGRAGGPFVALNCAAIPAGLIEAELFGHVEGAFSGARPEGSLGKARLAHLGTLFLDEVGDMPLPMQSALLRLLETRRVTALGDAREHAVDLALICASHQPLQTLVDQGRFRADLFFRLAGLVLELPPLRDRDDFVTLVQHILDEESPLCARRLTAEAMSCLAAHSWPGNLRELRNLMRLAVAMAGEETEIRCQHFDAGAAFCDTPKRSLREVESVLVRQAVARHHGNISAAARELKVTRSTLYRRLRGQ